MKKLKKNRAQIKHELKDVSKATGILLSAFSIVGLGVLIHHHHP